MIEDDLREILSAQLPGVPIYSRVIPMTLPECIVVQELGGTPSTAGIRRATHRVAVMAISASQEYAMDLRETARTALIKSMPAGHAGTHYYIARPLDSSAEKRKTPAGPKYIAFADLEVVASL